MQLKSITNVKDIPFAGVQFVKTDKSITEVIIGKLRIRKGESYSAALQVLIEAPHEEAKRYRLTATIEGFDPKVSYFDTKYEADSAANPLMDKGAEALVEEVTVLINDNGDVVGLAGEAVALPATDEMVPF